ncbi:MAG: 1-acyl-sn-glycerol-3-phosphate acyltransferase [Clostridia bacterium]|nr:1-acyl-sn-glycerol-3-phosphate acyltransferase [Clostridia bacterium]
MDKTMLWFAQLGAKALRLFSYNPELIRLGREERTEERKAFAVKQVGTFCSYAEERAGIKYDVRGRENIPVAGPVIYAPNHTSMWDAPVMITNGRNMPGFIMKEELGKIPGAHLWLEAIGCVFVKRDDIRDAASALLKAMDFVNDGGSMVVFPEGTRSKDGNMGEFKLGAFKLAQKTGAPLVPVVIKGAADRFENNGRKIKPGVIGVEFLSPVYLGGCSEEELVTAAAEVKQRLAEKLA